MNKLPSAYFSESNSDKADEYHRYGEIYDMAVLSLLHFTEQIKVLEIGVSRFGEGSAHAFCKMPFVEKFVGIDVSPLKTPLGVSGHFIHADAYTDETLNIVKQHGLFHLVIDDGSHENYHQKYFLNEYQSVLSNNSIMICEDITPETIDILDCKDVYSVKPLPYKEASNLLIKIKL